MAISFKSLSYIYDHGMPYEYKALDDINLDIRKGVITAIIGETGSGKSTLVQHLNALLLPTLGQLEIEDYSIVAGQKYKNLKPLRKQVGLVFQFCEYQLFEETVLKDVAFGPINFGVDINSANKIAMDALRLVGIDEKYYNVSPLDLSGGQARRVAIAGILACDPSILVLDEPTAGLDPKGAKDMISLFVSLNKKLNKTIIIVSHDNEMVYNYCEDTVVVKNGKIAFNGNTLDLFEDEDKLKELNLLLPDIVIFKQELIKKGFKVSKEARTVEQIVLEVKKQVRKK